MIDPTETYFLIALSVLLFIESMVISAFFAIDVYHNKKSVWIPISVALLSTAYIDNFFPLGRTENGKGDAVNICIVVLLVFISVYLAIEVRKSNEKKLISHCLLYTVIDVVLYSLLLLAVVFPNLMICDGYFSRRENTTVDCILAEKADEYFGDEFRFMPGTDTFSVLFSDTENDTLPDEIVAKKSLDLKVGDEIKLTVSNGLIYDWYSVLP